MSSMHFYAWEAGLKTGQYYLRTRPARDAIKFTVDIGALLKASDEGKNQELLQLLNKTNKNEKNIKKRRVATDPNEEPEAQKAKLEGEGEKPQEEEEEFPEFACENCSG